MKKLVLWIGLMACPAVSFAQVSVQKFVYDEISRRGGEPGGSAFTQNGLDINMDAIRVEAISGRLELEYITIRTENGDISFEDLLDMDPSNREEFDRYNGMFAENSNEPNSYVFYLSDTVRLKGFDIGIESWAANAIAQVELVLKSNPPPTPVPPQPTPPPGPSCRVDEVQAAISQCSAERGDANRSIFEIERNIRDLRDRLDERDREIQTCLREVSDINQEVRNLQSEHSSLPGRTQSFQNQTRDIKRRTSEIQNPVNRWSCFVIRRDGRRWEAQGINRVQVLQHLLQQCQVSDPRGQPCGEKWNPNQNGSWGCQPIG
ncbi:MAG: hypothetical protein KDD25_06765, partial [Bdellovibrionales bacterium]|nr:hypothetical protein [Bdellovibrionales bacterium]